MIICEGFDNTGKSWLCGAISKEFRLPLVKSYRPKAEYDIHQFNHWVNASPRAAVLDRHPAIADLIYGPILRGETPSSSELAQAARRNNYLVFCCPPIHSVIRSFGDRDQLEGVEENLQKLYQAYESLMESLEPDFIYDYTNPRAYRALINNLQQAFGRIE